MVEHRAFQRAIKDVFSSFFVSLNLLWSSPVNHSLHGIHLSSDRLHADCLLALLAICMLCSWFFTENVHQLLLICPFLPNHSFRRHRTQKYSHPDQQICRRFGHLNWLQSFPLRAHYFLTEGTHHLVATSKTAYRVFASISCRSVHQRFIDAHAF